MWLFCPWSKPAQAWSFQCYRCSCRDPNNLNWLASSLVRAPNSFSGGYKLETLEKQNWRTNWKWKTFQNLPTFTVGWDHRSIAMISGQDSTVNVCIMYYSFLFGNTAPCWNWAVKARSAKRFQDNFLFFYFLIAFPCQFSLLNPDYYRSFLLKKLAHMIYNHSNLIA